MYGRLAADARGPADLLLIVAPDDPRLRPTRKRLPIFPPSDSRGRWVRSAQGYRGGSPEIARLLAWIDAVAAHEDQESVLAALASADLRERERAEGRYTEAARLLAEQADPELRAAFAREDDSLEIILGHWDIDLGWHMGLAGLTYMECMATTASLNGEQPWEIARSDAMLSRRRRRMGETVPVEEVYKYLSTSARKLQVRFGQGERPGALLPAEDKKLPGWDEHFGRQVEGDQVWFPEEGQRQPGDPPGLDRWTVPDEDNPDPDSFID